MKKSIEGKIKLNSILVYLIIVALFTGSLSYVYTFRKNLDSQKKNVELYSAELEHAEKLISSVNAAQAELNLYIATKDTSHQFFFEKNIKEIKSVVNTLESQSTHSEAKTILDTVNVLLNQKGLIVQELNKTLEQKDLLSDINKFLNNYNYTGLKHLVNKRQESIQDTILTKAAEKKGFFKKLGALFKNKETQDTLKVSSKNIKEASHTTTGKRQDNLQPIKKFVKKASEAYIVQLVEIDEKINALVMADQQISLKISNLLMNYYSQIIHYRFQEIKNSEQMIRKYNNYTIIGGIIALFPIAISLLTILRNVNNAKRARIELENANACIRQVMESRHQLLLSVSHDIKTPLNSILGTLDLKRNDRYFDVSSINSMTNSGKHILALLNNLLGFSSIEQEKLTLQSAPFHLYAICMEIQELFIPLCKKKKLEFETIFNVDKETIINSDNLKLKQIIINLLSNAVKYTNSGKVSLQVAYSDGNLQLAVSDTGAGIPAEKLNHIFEPFVRIQENNNMAEGAGFGLYVVKGLVDLLKGEMEVKSKVGKGTSFTIAIPMEEIGQQTEPEKNKTIILIDDDNTLLFTLKSMVEQLGHRVYAFQSAEELGNFLNTRPEFDLVITDMEIGAHSGIDTLEMIQKRYPEIPVILMTARMDVQQEDVKRMGFSACFIKPISIDSLALMISHPEYNKETTSAIHSTNSERFQALREMVGNDEETIREILTLFISNGKKDIAELETYIDKHDFKHTQSKCHKMLSMYMQVSPEDKAIPLLKEIDASRKSTTPLPGWVSKTKDIIKDTRILIEEIEKYLA